MPGLARHPPGGQRLPAEWTPKQVRDDDSLILEGRLQRRRQIHRIVPGNYRAFAFDLIGKAFREATITAPRGGRRAEFGTHERYATTVVEIDEVHNPSPARLRREPFYL